MTCSLPIAIAGALENMFFGTQDNILVSNSIGYVHIYAFIGISSVFLQQKLGAKVAHALSPQMLKKCFTVLLLSGRCFFLLRDYAEINSVNSYDKKLSLE